MKNGTGMQRWLGGGLHPGFCDMTGKQNLGALRGCIIFGSNLTISSFRKLETICNFVSSREVQERQRD